MATIDLYKVIERMAALIRSEERKKCTELGIQAVHLQVLDYLSRCNRYSDTPAALTHYLGMTKGTVSQTLLLLERKGFILKLPDQVDKRMVHLHLIAAGREVLERAAPTELFRNAALILEQHYPQLQEAVYMQALTALQKAHKSHSFGLCKTCKYFTTTDQGFLCGLTQETLTQKDSEKICQEHTAA
ncbi:MAG: MarR family transcriptional regulator [Gammaproteobacteria bacterium HGW-Gammaproteobacteria-3]|jgi:DNA-binding MarR family transcriptional regulator|nr:MAG: MarR family transcriptional regulator [Gammaproteobacteria bacterium HGW-Gammaproteobacteria-3]